MPVRFKGLSEYQRNFLWKKSYLSESCNSSVGRKYPWAGLRSDQLGITKEPSFISKRRVPYHDPQISKSLEWNGAISESNVVASPEPEAPETPKSQEAEQKDVTQERVHSLEASRVPKRTRSHSADSRAEGASDVENNEGVTNHTPVNENVELEHSTKVLSENVDNGLDRLLRKKAGLTVVPSYNALRNSEYQRQFVWKTSKETAPAFAANQVFHNKSQFVPPFKGNSVIHETEYKRNFKGLSPVKEPKLRNDLRENRNLETVSPERKSNKIDDRLKLEAEMELKDLHQPKRKLTPWKHQRLGDPTSHKTLQKCPSTEPEEKGNIVEEQPQKNTTEKLGVSAPTIPVRRRLAWDTENTSEDVQKQPGEKEEEDDNEEEGDRKTGKQAFMGEQEKLDVREKSKADKMKEGSDSSVSSEKGGRLPTPKLRELGGIQRTHHDLTTPAVGGAVLVSPSKMKPPAPEQRKRMTSQDCLETSKNDFTKKESRAVSLLTSPAAGIKTVDPLPLREDSEDNIHKFAEATLPVSKIPKYPTNPPGQLPSPPHVPSYWHPSRRIQGSLRDPEFQHNVGKARMNNLQLPQHEAFNDEDEDRLSEISARSAASSLRAFQTLARAKKRKENFWGKT
ncbi:nuclear protein MDM1 isoform X1 [Homo sapiens]|uniref:nuclear protein MDM1 isoform X1 n=1 Tax=Homo sapiens TaxID=9606 RepID=UPI000387B760|nr:nuclear protein MDM1 isoform X1 [Homo sapiens]XP_054228543.1 nuclear protein MDM1 isoform X1 [Homo sapiens]